MTVSRTTVLVSNGLGMALDPTYFSLNAGLSSVWAEAGPDCLTSDDRVRIARLAGLPDTNSAPSSEDQLLMLHRVISACDFLNSVSISGLPWLTDEAQPFPNAVRAFIGKVALYFHEYPKPLEGSFVDRLCEFLSSTPCHIATLNYDNLLYQPLIEREVLKGYSGILVDGFHEPGFNRDNLEKKYGREFGWYLHLHGSPLFVSDATGAIRKLKQSEKDSVEDAKDGAAYRHVVLTHFRFKPEVILQSMLLSAYWDYFRKALAESSRLIIFGYSGFDRHVNEAISEMLEWDSIRVIIVEWRNPASEDEERLVWWRDQLGVAEAFPLELRRLPNILDYDWAD